MKAWTQKKVYDARHISSRHNSHSKCHSEAAIGRLHAEDPSQGRPVLRCRSPEKRGHRFMRLSRRERTCMELSYRKTKRLVKEKGR